MTDETVGARAGRSEGTGITAGVVLLLVGIAVALIVTAQNTRSVRFDFLWFEADLPLAVLLLAAVFLTLVVDELVGLVWRRRRRRARDLLRRRGAVTGREAPI